MSNQPTDEIFELDKIKIPGGTLDKYLDIYCKEVEEKITSPDDKFPKPHIYITFKFFNDKGIEKPFEGEKEKALDLCRTLAENGEIDMLKVINETIEDIMKGNI